MKGQDFPEATQNCIFVSILLHRKFENLDENCCPRIQDFVETQAVGERRISSSNFNPAQDLFFMQSVWENFWLLDRAAVDAVLSVVCVVLSASTYLNILI